MLCITGAYNILPVFRVKIDEGILISGTALIKNTTILYINWNYWLWWSCIYEELFCTLTLILFKKETWAYFWMVMTSLAQWRNHANGTVPTPCLHATKINWSKYIIFTQHCNWRAWCYNIRFLVPWLPGFLAMGYIPISWTHQSTNCVTWGSKKSCIYL